MKTFTLPMFVVLIGTLGTQYVLGDSPLDPYVGTWVIESLQVGDEKPEEYKDAKEAREILILTQDHAIYGSIDPVKKSISDLRHAHQLEGSSPEKIKAINVWRVPGRTNQGIGSVAYYSLSLDGDKLIKVGAWGSGKLANVSRRQVWVRLDDFSGTGPQNSSTLGDKLIGLKKAYDAGALTEREYQQEKAKLLNQK